MFDFNTTTTTYPSGNAQIQCQLQGEGRVRSFRTHILIPSATGWTLKGKGKVRTFSTLEAAATVLAAEFVAYIKGIKIYEGKVAA